MIYTLYHILNHYVKTLHARVNLKTNIHAKIKLYI